MLSTVEEEDDGVEEAPASLRRHVVVAQRLVLLLLHVDQGILAHTETPERPDACRAS